MVEIFEHLPYSLLKVKLILVLVGLNPFKPNGIFHLHQFDLSISVLRFVGWYLIFIQILVEHSVNKPWKP